MSHSHSHGSGQSSGHSHDHNHGHDFDPHHPNAFCHTLLRRRETARPDYLTGILDFIKQTNDTWTWELRANDAVLQLTIPCPKEQKGEVDYFLLRAITHLDFVNDWVIVETIHNKEATDVSKKAIERALKYKDGDEKPQEPEAHAGEASGS
ncbi:hypothetical protein ACHAP7_011504 [Fusarium lateritium]